MNNNPHRRYNVLTGDWVLVSPHRTKRPWQGKQETAIVKKVDSYDETCYLCPTNIRMSGDKNPNYEDPFSFVNDFSALLSNTPDENYTNGLLQGSSERGVCKVVCFSPESFIDITFNERGKYSKGN